MRFGRRHVVSTALLTAVACFAALPAQAHGHDGGDSDGWEVVAEGLHNPRHLNFGPDGALYVAEAGRGGDGPCVAGPEGSDLCVGDSGSVTRIDDHGQERVRTGIPSLAQASGREGLGLFDVGFDGAGRPVATVGLGLDPRRRVTDLGPLGPAFGRLYREDLNGNVEVLADIGDYEIAQNPDQTNPAGAVEIDTNGTGLAFEGDDVLLADAGGNSLLRITPDGRVSTVATFPDGMTLAPASLNLPPGARIPYSAVPTSVEVGPDGDYYVGQLTGFPFPAGEAQVFRVPAGGGEPVPVATGFTNIIDIAFDADGNLYVAEISANGLLSGDNTGAVIRLAADGTRSVIAAAGLTRPGGIAVGPDGDLYVSNCGDCVEDGTVVRIDPDVATKKLATTLTGDQEIGTDGQRGAGDPDGYGSATVTVTVSGVCFDLFAANIALPAAAAHIHQAVAGVNGPIVVPLAPPDADQRSAGCVVGGDPALLAALSTGPRQYYVNVHNADFPAGAVRGQLARFSHRTTSLAASLDGAQEIGGDGLPGAGDTDGMGLATVKVRGDDRLSVEISVRGITLPAAAAHIHRGEVGVNGPIVVTLHTPGADGRSCGCVDVDPELLADILARPAEYYVNVHTADFPAGAVRGNLGPASG